MGIGGTIGLKKENMSLSTSPSVLLEPEKSKPSLMNYSLLKKPIITIHTKELIENKQHPLSARQNIPIRKISIDQSSLSSKSANNTESIAQDIRQSTSGETKTFIKQSQTSNNISSTDTDPFNPEFCRQRQAAINNMEYRKIIDSWEATSLNEIINLIKNFSIDKSLIDRAWIVFYWVSQNIEYDIDSYFTGYINHQTSNDIFRNKKGVCDAYGSIYKSICDGIKLECKKIGGYAKGYGYLPGKTILTRTDHAWNVVKIHNQWYLIDSTWGAGHIDMNKQYQKRLNLHYFLTRPEHMIYNHYPEDSKWQLLSPSLSMQQFLRLPYVHSIFFDFQLEIISPSNINIVSFDTERELAEVLIRTPPNVYLSCSIAHDKTTGLVQYDIDRKLWQCLFRPHANGYHQLDIYACQGQSTGYYDGAIIFGLNMPNMTQFKNFPLTYSQFTENKCQIFEPLVEKLKRGTKVTIHCRIPNARYVRLSYDGHFSSKEYKLINDIFKQEITVPNQELAVFVKFLNNQKSNSYDGLFKYIVE